MCKVRGRIARERLHAALVLAVFVKIFHAFTCSHSTKWDVSPHSHLFCPPSTGTGRVLA